MAAVQKESKKDKDEKASLEKQSASSDKSSYSTSSDYKMYRAVFDFNGQNSDDLVFKKDDRLRVLKDSQTSEWWIAHNMRTGQEGSIPANYVTADDSSHEAQKWFFKTGSVGVENLLTDASLKPGTFLVRICSDKKNYVLCLRGDTEPGQQLPKILRYRIQKTPDNKYLISEKLVFDSLVELVDHYHLSKDGLAYLLTEACPHVKPVLQFRELEMPRSKLKLSKLLGKGSFGEVYSATFGDKIEVAVKKIRTGSMTVDQFLNEAKIMHQLRHENLVQLIGICTKENPVLIITELMTHGALCQLLRKDRGRSLHFPLLMNFASQIANGMCYLEKKGFVHRDLRSANVLVGKNLAIKVADFGLTKVMQNEKYSPTRPEAFPIRWTAPEAAVHLTYSAKSDVWSFGIVLYEIITYGSEPYSELGQNIDANALLHKLRSGYKMPNPDKKYLQSTYGEYTVTRLNCPSWLYDIFVQCCSLNPQDRPEFRLLQQVLGDYYERTMERLQS